MPVTNEREAERTIQVMILRELNCKEPLTLSKREMEALDLIPKEKYLEIYKACLNIIGRKFGA